MRNLLNKVGAAVLRLLRKQMASHWRKSKAAWVSEWHAPARSLRLMYLGMGLVIAYVLVPAAYGELGFLGAGSYILAMLSAISNATVFRIVKIGRTDYIPLGLMAPIAILIGIVGSNAIKPLLSDAKEAALAHDFIGAAAVIGVFIAMNLWFRKWKSGNPYR